MTSLCLTLLALVAMTQEPATLACGAFYAVPAPIVRALIWHESRGKTTARQGTHRGLMQLKARYSRVPPAWLHVPAVGVCEGVRHLAACQDRCQSNRTRASSAEESAGLARPRGARAATRAPRSLRCALAYYACGHRALTAECGQGFAETIQRRAR